MGRSPWSKAAVLITLAIALVGVVLADDADESLPACAQGRAKTFLVGFTGHTGSTAMISMMMQHSQIWIPSLEPLTYRQNKFEFAKLTFENETIGSRIKGFKIRPKDLEKAEDHFGQLVKEHRTRLITLTRENVFKAAMGLYTIRALLDNSAMMGLSKEQIKEHCDLRPDSCRYEVRNLPFFAWLMHRYALSGRMVESLKNQLPWQCELKITYEEFLRNRDKTMTKIYRYLGLNHEATLPRFEKVVSDNPCEVITNYQDVCAELWGCEELRQYIEDPDHSCYCLDKARPRNDNLCSDEKLLKANLVCYDHQDRAIPCSM